jgi:ribosomal silencing factor RsfS
MEAKQLALLCRELADAKKAEDIVILDMRALTERNRFFRDLHR